MYLEVVVSKLGSLEAIVDRILVAFVSTEPSSHEVDLETGREGIKTSHGSL